ncbi:ABC transporter permease [Aestuariimicrobium sp. T2.26MG-19.2B]|uniref:ABC transporter permease n=1 Tax=Aestuariimicrobium sp. T2.26MG-19.2B TaxID=3040679 RepID=UPI00247788B7|nr:ABC-2 family transporter protein [Aestuariimicrobium sp. T2.26MG-19.2B]CAI9409214.1 hypothetical protein AESSP_02191 [Aestuariimicrobium sp. T2.26MG-19.2B]
MSEAAATPVKLGRLRPRSPYQTIAGATFQQAVAYRWTTFMNVGLTFVWVVILYYLWRAAYASRPAIQGYSWDQMRTYIVIAYGLNALVGWRIGSGMMQTIRSGDVVLDYVRPLNYATTQLARAAGGSLVEGVVSLVLVMGLGVAWLRILPPASPGATALFVIAVVLGFLTKALVVFLVSLLVFWTQSGVGLMWTQQAVIQVLSGTIVPLALMPGWLRIIAEWAPLRGIASTPLTFYLGKADPTQTAILLGAQVAWLVVLWALANLAWRRAFNVVNIQGG